MMDTPSGGDLNEIVSEITAIGPFLDGVRDDFGEFTRAFGSLLSGYTEVSISPHNSHVGVMTRGSGSDFTGNLRKYLEYGGVNGDAVEAFNCVEQFFTDINLMIKQDFTEDGRFDLTLYWQRFVSLKNLYSHAVRHFLTRENFEYLRESSLLLRCNSSYIGMGFLPPGELAFRFIFSNNIKKNSSYLASGLAALLAKTGAGAETINYFLGFHEYLSSRSAGNVFTSLDFHGNNPESVKIDYDIIPVECACQMMQALNLPKSEEKRLKDAMETMKMGKVTYVGIRFGGGSRPTLKFYLDRRFSEKNRDNPEILADFLRNTIWVP